MAVVIHPPGKARLEKTQLVKQYENIGEFFCKFS